MGAHTEIAWTDATFNPWWGCTHVSPGCDHCYAEGLARRFGTTWGPGHERRFFGVKHWAEPLKWNRKAEKAGIPHKVFCASMSDWADNTVDQSHREQLFALIRETPWLRWQLLTKRIGNVPKMLPQDWGTGYPNVWLGITVVNQEEANRDIPKLLHVPAVVRFLSCEPLLGPINVPHVDELSWVIVGGESGSHARPMHLDWARSLVEQCHSRGIAAFVKQLGGTRDKRADFAAFPADIQVRAFPPLEGANSRANTLLFTSEKQALAEPPSEV